MSNECMSMPPLLADFDPVEDVMDMVCRKCRFLFICANEDELEEKCDGCGIEKAIRALKFGTLEAKQ